MTILQDMGSEWLQYMWDATKDWFFFAEVVLAASLLVIFILEFLPEPVDNWNEFWELGSEGAK